MIPPSVRERSRWRRRPSRRGDRSPPRATSGWSTGGSLDGPQYAQLRSEADSILPGGVYDFALAEGVVVMPGLVRGTVTITGGNGATQTYLWDFELIHQDNRWRVWTVRTTPEGPET